MVGSQQVVVAAHCHHLIIGVERLRLKGVVGHETLLLARETHLAACLEDVGREGGVPQADLINASHKLTVVLVASVGGACAACAHNHAITGCCSNAHHAGGQGALSIHIHGHIAVAKDVESHVVPSLIVERCGAGSEGVVSRCELQHTVGVHPQLHLARLQQLGLALLLVGAHPQFDGAVVGGERRYVGGRNVEMRRAVERNGLVLVVEIPVLARQAEVSVAGIVGDDGAFALVHLPVANQVACGRILGLVLLHQRNRHVVSLIP